MEIDVDSMIDWYLLGYYAGEKSQLAVPVINLKHEMVPNIDMLKGFNAAAASSGGIMMYHVAGVTPEAPALEAAFGHKKITEALTYGHAERRQTYETPELRQRLQRGSGQYWLPPLFP